MDNYSNNFNEIYRKLENLENKDFSQALYKAALVIERDAKMLCPVDTGDLKRSITAKDDGFNEASVGTNVHYAPYVEFGTGLFSSKGDGRKDRWSYQDAEGKWHSTIGQYPQPYMHPAFMNNIETVKREVLEAVREALHD